MAPVITCVVAVLFSVFYWLAPLSAGSPLHANNETFWLFVLNTQLPQEAWRWLTAHLIHTNLNHLGWNLGAWLLLAGMIESRSRWKLVYTSLAGAGGVCLWFFFFNAQFNYYAGASGMLNALFVVVLNQSRQFLSKALVTTIAIGAIAKIAYELVHQLSLVGDAAWPPTPAAHLAGFVAGVVVLCATGIVNHVSDSKLRTP